MKLSTLARKAAELPDDVLFDWAGPEQFHDSVFEREITTLPEAIEYIDQLRQRMASYAMALHDLTKAYKQMRDLMLDAEVDAVDA